MCDVLGPTDRDLALAWLAAHDEIRHVRDTDQATREAAADLALVLDDELDRRGPEARALLWELDRRA